MIDVVVCDDSAIMRAILADIIGRDPSMRCVGEADNPYAARELIKRLEPHVLTLDVEMPRMNGLDFLEKLMRLRPMPVIMVSTLTQRGTEIAIKALELGAVDIVGKFDAIDGTSSSRFAAELVTKIRVAAQSRVRRHSSARVVAAPTERPADRYSDSVIAIGASTGGCQAVGEIISALPSNVPGLVIAQHMPALFTRSYATRLDANSRIRVKEAEDGEPLLMGHAYIAPGDHHLRVKRVGGHFRLGLDDGPRRNRFRPSVDVLFESVSVAAKKAIGIILTGMGEDGAAGLLQMQKRSAFTIAQDEATSVVFGMPKSAIALGAAQAVLPLDAIVPNILKHLKPPDGVSTPKSDPDNVVAKVGHSMTKLILTVDDSASIRQMVSSVARTAGYDVIEAFDGVDALEVARKHDVALILTDYNMPRLNGIGLITELRAWPTYASTPMLVLTTEASEELKARGRAALATGWLTKPFDPKTLLAVIQRFIGNS